MSDLARGANASVSGPTLELSVSGARQGTVDLMVFQLTAAGSVRRDEDFVFFNQPASPEGAVRLTAADRVAIDLARVPADVANLAVAVSLDDSVPGSLAAIGGLGVTVSGPADRVAAPAAGLTTERAAVLLEVYRRQDTWKVRNVSAGWSGGFADLVRNHGVAVDDEPAAPAAPPVPEGPRSVPGEERLSLRKREKLDLRKREVHKVLLTKGAQHERARVILVMDKTGSMYDEYRDQIVHRVIEKMVPVATQLDDDGALECYFYAVTYLRVPDLRVGEMEQWIAEFVHIGGTHGGYDYGAIGGYNNEIPIMSHLVSDLAGATTPTLVLFFTDGGFSKKREITRLLKDASSLPAFWQFVGIGDNNFGVLTRLDEMTGRVVDNVGFFSVSDIDRIDDAELYRRLLSEFPDWLKAARGAGILR